MTETLAETVRRMQRRYLLTGTIRGDDLARVLGDPRTSFRQRRAAANSAPQPQESPSMPNQPTRPNQQPTPSPTPSPAPQPQQEEPQR